MNSYYKIPDKNVFGHHPNSNEEIKYGDARSANTDSEKILFLKGRLDSFLFKQISPFGELTEIAEPKIWSPFPLTMLTLLSIETLGRIISDVERIEKNSENKSRDFSRPIYKMIDSKLYAKPSKSFNESFEKRFKKSERKKFEHCCDVLHKYLRNSFYHGFQGKAVFLDHKHSSWSIEDGFLVLNPYWLWKKCNETYQDIFATITDKKNHDSLKNALNFFDKLIE